MGRVICVHIGAKHDFYFGCLVPKDLKIILISNLSILRVPDKVYSRKASCAPHLIHITLYSFHQISLTHKRAIVRMYKQK